MRRLTVPLLGVALGLGLLYAAPDPAPQAPPTAPSVAEAQETVVVYKSPTCGCCTLWEDHLRESGFAVESHLHADLAALKASHGIGPELASCHTAVVDGYVIEGHVPASAIERLLAERPDARGLTVPGMPLGSPGMEIPSGEVEPYEVLLLGGDGSTAVFARFG